MIGDHVPGSEFMAPVAPAGTCADVSRLNSMSIGDQTALDSTVLSLDLGIADPVVVGSTPIACLCTPIESLSLNLSEGTTRAPLLFSNSALLLASAVEALLFPLWGVLPRHPKNHGPRPTLPEAASKLGESAVV